MTWKFFAASALLALAIALTIALGDRCSIGARTFALGHMLLSGCRE